MWTFIVPRPHSTSPSPCKSQSIRDAQDEHFVGLLTMHQGQLRGFILASVGDFQNAADILQKTNLKIWQKADAFHRDQPFLPWAFAIARYEVLAFLRDRGRERIVFQPDVSEMLTDVFESRYDHWDPKQLALHQCLDQLCPEHTRLISLRYAKGMSLAGVASETGRSIESVKCILLRMRRKLKQCIQHRLAESS
ncbi:sigma-70 family RNA polymerase sigma factor [Stieleria tagensis]|uniref:sigma-70 family RNA polymerase sigma factor n=1 Tax=Stieleria tagensis TaxID=2956795 RepID=UPI0036F3A1D1